MANQGELMTRRESGALGSGSGGRHPLDSLRREFDRMFESFTTALPMFGGGRDLFDLESVRRAPAALGGSAPAVDVVEKENEYAISAELPGLDEKDVEVTVADGVLTLKGEKKEEREEKTKDYYLSERSFGSFRRSFRLPDDVDVAKIDASFRKGVLRLTLPKSAAAKPKSQKIAIKAG
jgi:HSP20 family protein